MKPIRLCSRGKAELGIQRDKNNNNNNNLIYIAHFLIQAQCALLSSLFLLAFSIKIDVEEMSLYCGLEGVDCRRVFDMKGQFVPKSRASNSERACPIQVPSAHGNPGAGTVTTI
jgi:hypothetical protein